ncbi:HAD family hydrolase [Stackebrandtia soli]|uniref:HAD family hydrolase n=1 Tax=Stackebrandtia soli TaxID=1892856 RepID=UPI0039EAD692
MTRGALRAVLFDMDGTLLDSEKLWEVGLVDLCVHLGRTLTPQLRARMVGMDQMESMRLLHKALDLPADGVTASADWLIDRMADLFASPPVWRPGAAELLASVRAAGYPTALVTATGRRLVDVVIGAMGADRFDVTIVGDEVANNKPDPEPYRTAATALGLLPGDCLAIEDSPTGVASALAAGCSVVAVPSEVAITVDGVTVVDSLVDIDVQALRALHSGSR